MFGQSGCIRAKVVVFGKVVVLGQNWFNSGEVDDFGQGGGIWAKVNVFGQSGFIWSKVVVLGQKWLHSARWL